MPWRDSPTPYSVWVSEVMLQQTRVSVVIPYFHRWMARFPTIQALATAPLESVIKCWEGLGYYSRARNLHAGAQQVVRHFGGELPRAAEELSTIRGIGPYTVGAIRAFAFHERAAAIDGNVTRLISRLYRIEADVTRRATVREIERRVESLLPRLAPWEVAEALIELGATVCTPKPQCHLCPLAAHCRGREIAGELPRKPARQQITRLIRQVYVVRSGDSLLIRRESEQQLMRDLHSFPMEEPELSLTRQQTLASVKHSYTRFQVTLEPALYSAEAAEVPGYFWVTLEEARGLPFSAGHRQILAALSA